MSQTKGEAVYYATGKRKTSAARVFLRPGKGNLVVNGMPLEKYLPTPTSITKALSPFAVTETKGMYDANITVSGGGKIGQAGAIAHGITRALLVIDSDKLRAPLKKAGMVTRDDRMVERKKYGLHKARKRGQYSKR
ncbi:MAG: 30S ribosomal protein S9 [Bdellovibrionales bacterium RBG_16_40_8]|nr:MAG: 30S ribosomal protein S9 [Bdellovibrionales bacterium RBG_16_40_8]